MGVAGAVSQLDGDSVSALDKFFSGMSTRGCVSELEKERETEGREGGGQGGSGEKPGKAGHPAGPEPSAEAAARVQLRADAGLRAVGGARREMGWQRWR